MGDFKIRSKKDWEKYFDIYHKYDDATVEEVYFNTLTYIIEAHNPYDGFKSYYEGIYNYLCAINDSITELLTDSCKNSNGFPLEASINIEPYNCLNSSEDNRSDENCTAINSKFQFDIVNAFQYVVVCDAEFATTPEYQYFRKNGPYIYFTNIIHAMFRYIAEKAREGEMKYTIKIRPKYKNKYDTYFPLSIKADITAEPITNDNCDSEEPTVTIVK